MIQENKCIYFYLFWSWSHGTCVHICWILTMWCVCVFLLPPVVTFQALTSDMKQTNIRTSVCGCLPLKLGCIAFIFFSYAQAEIQLTVLFYLSRIRAGHKQMVLLNVGQVEPFCWDLWRNYYNGTLLLRLLHGVYWVIQRSWFARVNALCNLSHKKSREVTAHFRASFWVGVASRCV